MKKDLANKTITIVISYVTDIIVRWFKYKDEPKKARRLRNKDGSFTFDIGDKDVKR